MNNIAWSEQGMELVVYVQVVAVGFNVLCVEGWMQILCR